MQFLPTSSSTSAMGGVSSGSSSSYSASSGGDEFLDSFNQELAAAGVTPIEDISVESERPSGFRSIKQDQSSTLDEEDVNYILEKLRKNGVDDSALGGLAGLLNADGSLTIGNIMASLGHKGRLTGELTESEMQDLETAFQKLQLSPEESEEVMALMLGGHGAAALRILRGKAQSMGEDGLALNKSEVHALMRGLDLSDDAMQKVSALFGADDDAMVNGKMLDRLFGPASAEFAKKQSEQEKLAATLKQTIEDALQAKKLREATSPVGDARGSRKADRAETRMRDDMTAKGNGLGSQYMRDLEEKTLVDENASRERNYRQNAFGGGKGVGAQANEAGKRPSKAREGFSSVIHRVDMAPGMMVPAESGAASAQPAQSTAHMHRQEIFSQVEQGMLQQLQDGSRQMTLRLDPGELGQMTLLLTVKGGEVRALIRADNPETAAVLSEQMEQLKQTLEDQGLKVAQLDVETQLPKDTTQDQWSNMNQMNQEQEMREQARFMRLAKLRRESGTTLAQDMQSKSAEEEISSSGMHGMHIIA